MRASGLLCQGLVNNNKLNNSVNSVLLLMVIIFLDGDWRRVSQSGWLPYAAMKITLKKEEVTKILQCVQAAYLLNPYSVQLCNEDNFNCSCYSGLGCCISIPKKNALIIIMWFCYCKIIGYV